MISLKTIFIALAIFILSISIFPKDVHADVNQTTYASSDIIRYVLIDGLWYIVTYDLDGKIIDMEAVE